MELLLPLAAILISASAAVTMVKSSMLTTVITDNDLSGYTKSLAITAGTGGVPALEEISNITRVTVDLTFTGGRNGDLFVHLVHNSTIAILLNRVGRDTLTPEGSSSSANVHDQAPASGTYTGTFSSDGRESHFETVVSSDPRIVTLSNFTDTPWRNLRASACRTGIAGHCRPLQAIAAIAAKIKDRSRLPPSPSPHPPARGHFSHFRPKRISSSQPQYGFSTCSNMWTSH